MGRHTAAQRLTPHRATLALWSLACLVASGACSLTFDDHALPRAGCAEDSACDADVDVGGVDGGGDLDAAGDAPGEGDGSDDNAAENNANNSAEDNNAAPACLADDDCEPSPCHSAACVDGVCVLNRTLAAECDDGDPCTQGDRCDDQGRCSGAPLRCEPSEPTCDETDAIYTTFQARCEGGECVQVPSPLECPSCREKCLGICENVQCNQPEEPCMTARCQPALEGVQCVAEALPEDSRCAFVGPDNSTAGWCQSGRCVQCRSAADCDDNDPCTREGCEEGFCSSLPADGQACQGGVCSGGACVECINSSDCSGSFVGCRVPTCVQNQCIDEEKPDGSPCYRGPTRDGYCLSGSCVLCATDEHCAQSPMTPWCNQGVCGACDQQRPETCADGDPCSNDVCSNGACFFIFDRTHEGDPCTRIDEQMREVPGRCNQIGRCE